MQNRASKPKTTAKMGRNIKVLFVIQKLAGLTGGAERVLIETAKAMGLRGFAVSIVSFDTRAGAPVFDTGDIPVRSLFPYLRAAIPPGSSAHRAGRAERLVKAIPNVFPLTHAKWRISHGAFAHALRRYIKAEGIDVVVALMPPAITAAYWATRGTGVPFIASTHNLPEQDFGATARWDQNPVYRRRAVDALAAARFVTVLLPEFLDWFPAAMRSRIKLLPNAVGRLAPLTEGQREDVILGVGRLTPIKRYDWLIDGFASLSSAFPDWRLRIFGDGPERANLQAQIDALGLAARIAMEGNSPAIGAAYDQAAIMCHPSEFEGFGLSVAEALAHGLPVVAFADCPGVNTLVSDGVDGVLVTPDTKQALAAALAGMMQDAELRQKMGQAAATLPRPYAAETIYDQWEAMLREAASGTAMDAVAP